MSPCSQLRRRTSGVWQVRGVHHLLHRLLRPFRGYQTPHSKDNNKPRLINIANLAENIQSLKSGPNLSLNGAEFFNEIGQQFTLASVGNSESVKFGRTAALEQPIRQQPARTGTTEYLNGCPEPDVRGRRARRVS